MRFCGAARFARVEGEVRAEDFLEGSFIRASFLEDLFSLKLLYENRG